MVCEISDELGIRYLVALDSVRRAELALHQAVTLTNVECAATELRRVEAHRYSIICELVEHCEGHGCATPELEEICRTAQKSRAMVAA